MLIAAVPRRFVADLVPEMTTGPGGEAGITPEGERPPPELPE